MDTMNGTRDASRVRLLGKRGLRRVYSPCVVSGYFADIAVVSGLYTRRNSRLLFSGKTRLAPRVH